MSDVFGLLAAFAVSFAALRFLYLLVGRPWPFGREIHRSRAWPPAPDLPRPRVVPQKVTPAHERDPEPPATYRGPAKAEAVLPPWSFAKVGELTRATAPDGTVYWRAAYRSSWHHDDGAICKTGASNEINDALSEWNMRIDIAKAKATS